jgi:hypothetical protein
MPVLYLPEQKMFVACNRVVKSIKENEIIKPTVLQLFANQRGQEIRL